MARSGDRRWRRRYGSAGWLPIPQMWGSSPSFGGWTSQLDVATITSMGSTNAAAPGPARLRRLPPRRLARACVGGLIGVVAVAAVVAYAAHHWFYVMLLYGFLIGMTGGLMAWMVVDELDPELQGSRIMAIAGLASAAVAYLLYEYLRYRFDVAGSDPRPGWWAHLTETAQAGAAFGRLGRTSTIDLGAGFVWGSRVLELSIAMACGAGVARAVDFRR